MKFIVPRFTINSTLLFCGMMLLTMIAVSSITPSHAQITVLGVTKTLEADSPLSIHHTDLFTTNIPFNQFTLTFDFRDASHENVFRVSDGASRSSSHDNDFLVNKETVMFEVRDPTFRGTINIDFMFDYRELSSQSVATIQVIEPIIKLDFRGYARIADDCLTESQTIISADVLTGHFGAVKPENPCFENHTFTYTRFLIDTNDNIINSEIDKSHNLISGDTPVNIQYHWTDLESGTLYGYVLVMTGNYNAQGQSEYVDSTVFHILSARTIGDPQRTCSINNMNTINFGEFYDGQTSNENIMTIINNGTEIAAVNLSADDWVDGNKNKAMDAQQTVVSNTPNTGFDEKIPLLSDMRIATIQLFDQSHVYIQTKVVLLEDDFRGQIMQDMTMTLVC